jgi:hypothetical protein
MKGMNNMQTIKVIEGSNFWLSEVDGIRFESLMQQNDAQIT